MPFSPASYFSNSTPAPSGAPPAPTNLAAKYFNAPTPAPPTPPPSMANLGGAPLLAPTLNGSAPLMPTTPTPQPQSIFTIAPKTAPTPPPPPAPVAPPLANIKNNASTSDGTPRINTPSGLPLTPPPPTPATPAAPATPPNIPTVAPAPQSTIPVAPANTGQMNVPKDVYDTITGVAMGLYNSEVHPGADEQTVEQGLTSAPKVSNPLLQKVLNVTTDIGAAPARAYLRAIQPMLDAGAVDIGQTIGAYQIAKQMQAGQINPEQGAQVLNDLGVIHKSAPQIVGDMMTMVLGVLTPDTAGEILGLGGETAAADAGANIADSAGNSRLANVASGFMKGGKSALPIGGAFGVGQALSSGSTDPKVIAQIMAQNLAGAFLLGGVTGGLGGALHKPMSIDEAMNTVADLYRQTKSPEVRTLLADTLQSLQDKKAVGSIGNQEELPAPAPDAAQIAADQPAQKPQSEAEVNAQAPVEPTPSFLPKAPLSTPAGGTVDLSGRNTGEPFSDIAAKPTMFDSVVRKLSQPKINPVQDITPPPEAFSKDVNIPAIKKAYQFVSPNTEENLTFDQASKNLNSTQHLKMQGVTHEIDSRIGVKSDSQSAIGDWSDGAENTLFTTIENPKSYEEVQYSAALKGLALNQKAVIPFAVMADGPDSLYTFDAGKEGLVSLRQKMDAAGLQYRTIVPTPEGNRVIIFDKGTELADKVTAFENENNFKVDQYQGRGEFLGSDNSREEGAKIYQQVINNYEERNGTKSGESISNSGSSASEANNGSGEGVSESNGGAKQGVSSGNDNGAKAGSTGENQPVEAGSKANGNAEGPVNADGSPAKTAEPSATDSGIKTSKIAESIKAKAIEAGITKDFGKLASYDPTTVKAQAEKISDLMTNDMNRARAIVRGELPIPDKMSSTYLIKAMEDYATETRNGEMIKELAQSPLTSETSVHAQELRMAGERDPDSPVEKAKEIQAAREKSAATTAGKTVEEATNDAVKDVQTKTARPAKVDWATFIQSIQC